MNDDRDESPVKPTVIDLDAEDVVTDSDEMKSQPAEGQSRARVSSKLFWPGTALLLGLIAGGWFYRDVLSSYLPSSGLSDATARVVTLEQQTRAIADQTAAATSKLAGDVTKLGQQTESSEKLAARAQAATVELGKRLDDLDAKLAVFTADLEKLKSAPAPAVVGSGSAANPDAVAALAQRVAELEKDVAGLKSGMRPSDQSAKADVISQTLADLKAKIATGAPYKEEMDRIQRLVPAAAGLDMLVKHANEGLPTPEGLALEMTHLIPSLPKSESVTADNAGYLDGLWNAVSGIITIRRIGEPDWAALATRVADAARSGDLPGAIAMIDKSEGGHPAGIDQWRDRAKARLNVEAALVDASQSVARQLSSMSSAP
jgi:hypothetical protein